MSSIVWLSFVFAVLFQYEDYPNSTHHLTMQTLPLPEDAFSANLTWEQQDVLRHTFFPDAEYTKLAGIYKVGVRLRCKYIRVPMLSPFMFLQTLRLQLSNPFLVQVRLCKNQLMLWFYLQRVMWTWPRRKPCLIIHGRCFWAVVASGTMRTKHGTPTDAMYGHKCFFLKVKFSHYWNNIDVWHLL